MRLRTRLLAALPIVGLFAALPSVDARARFAQAPLRVHEWLLGDDSPLAGWRQGGSVPPLDVELLPSPPITERAAETAKYAGAAHAWAAERSAAGDATRVDAARGRLPLQVRIGDHGIRAETVSPTGAAIVHGMPFGSRLALLPFFVTTLLLVLTGRATLALLAGGVIGAITHVATAVPGREVGVLDAAIGGSAHFAAAAWRTLQQPLLVALVVAASVAAAWHAARSSARRSTAWPAAARAAIAAVLACTVYRVTASLGAGAFVAVATGIAPAAAFAAGLVALVAVLLVFRRRAVPAGLPQ